MSPFRLWLYRWLTGWLPESRGFAFKRALLRFAGAKVGANVRIYSSARILGTGSLVIGDDVHVGSEVMIYSVSPAGITIGSHVDIGPRVMLLTGTHEVALDGPHAAGKGIAQSTTVGDGCWLGAASTLLPGVSLSPRTIVAAGAVVVKSLEGALLAGVPARRVR